MGQAIVTIIFGLIGTLLAQWLTEIHRKAQAAAEAAQRAGQEPDFMLVWLTDVSNGDVLAMIQIVLIFYLYGRIRAVQRQVSDAVAPKPNPSSILATPS